MPDVRCQYLGLVWLLLSSNGFAQANDSLIEPDSLHVVASDLMRSRIQMDRKQAQDRYQMEESVCYTLFSVSDCIRLARVGRREVLDKLRHEEKVLNDHERKRKALAQAQQIEQRTYDQRLKAVAERFEQSHQMVEPRLEQGRQNTVASVSKASPQGSIEYKIREQGRTRSAIAHEQKQYQAKLKAAEAHRANRLKTSSEKTAASIKSLPLPIR